MRLLVIEDERVLCETIVRSLRRLAYSVDYCYNGEKALELLDVAKPFHLAELEARIRSLTLRQFTQQDVLLTCGDLIFDTRSRMASVSDQPMTLTRKETGILEYLMVHQGRPVSQEELMDHVWDNSVDNFSNSIRVHISALRKKLRTILGYDPIRNRIGEGYLMGGKEV